MADQNRTIQDEMEDEDIQKIKDEFKEEPETVKFRANRVPKWVSDDLKDEANEKFAGDYGMALTYWRLRIKRLDNLITTVNDLTKRVVRMEQRIEELNSEDEDNDTKSEKTLN